MFQFPAFALLTLCIQEKSTCFCSLSSLRHDAPNRPRAGAERASRSDNNKQSGGFPHSEIPGSKGALASPGLIAECHVLHRLLPPRHPPNALIALDPIQKKTGPFAWRGFVPSSPSRLASGRKSFDPHPHVSAEEGASGGAARSSLIRRNLTVSYIFRLGKTVDVTHVDPAGRTGLGSAEPVAHPGRDPLRARPSRGVPLSGSPRGTGQHVDIHVSCYCSLDDVKSLISRSDCATHPWMRRAVGSSLPRGVLVEPIGIEPMTLCLQSRCSPS